MELRHLLYFKTVAEELHFRKAADKLFISQPPLSRQIKELEEEMGVTLFDRNNKRVALTEAGKYFKKQVDAIFSNLQLSKETARQIHGSVSGTLNIGYISSTYHQHLINILKEIKENFPFVKTRLYEVPSVKQVKALEEGKLDVGIIRAPVKSEKLKVQHLFNDPFSVILPGKNKDLSNSELVEYLKDKPFVFYNKDYAPGFSEKLMEICQRFGFQPEVQHEANNVNSILRLVESGLGVSILPSSLAQNYTFLNVTFYPLTDIRVSSDVVLAFRSDGLSPAAAWFVENFPDYFN